MNSQDFQFCLCYENRLICYITTDLIVKNASFFKKIMSFSTNPSLHPSFFLYAFSVDFCATHAKSNESR